MPVQSNENCKNRKIVKICEIECSTGKYYNDGGDCLEDGNREKNGEQFYDKLPNETSIHEL